MRKYRIVLNRFNVAPKIIEIEVERETSKCVWIEGRRHFKRNDNWYNYYDTWEEAKNALLERQKSIVYNNLERYTESKLILFNIKALSA